MKFIKRLFEKSMKNNKVTLENTTRSQNNQENKTSSHLNIKGLTEIGYLDKCPYCLKKLDKIPTRKKKCEFCAEFIYVRTRPLDRKKILVTDKQIEEIENQWQIYHCVKPLIEDPIFYKVKKDLTKEFGMEPFVNDVLWRIYNNRIVEYASQKQWGNYSLNKQNMALLLKSERRLKQALNTFFEVCYLDLNNFNSLGTVALGNVEELISKLNISEKEAEAMFCTINEKMKPVKKMPVSTKDAWEKLYAEIETDKKIVDLKVDDYDSIFAEIDLFIKKEEYNRVAEIIQKLKSYYYLKSRIIDSPDKLKMLLNKMLKSDQVDISSAAESLFILLVKKDSNLFEDLILDYVDYAQQNLKKCVMSHIIGQLGNINSTWLKKIIPDLILIIKEDPEWNCRRFAAFNIGAIGSKDPELVKDAIPFMIDYIKNPKEITKKESLKIETKEFLITVNSSLGIDQTQWLKDAYIDTLGMIAKGNASYIEEAIPILRKIEKKDKSEYSKKKAKNTLDIYEKGLK